MGDVLEGGGVTTINRMVKEDLFEKGMLEKIISDKKGQETKIWKQRFLSRGNNKVQKPPEERGCSSSESQIGQSGA